MNLFDLDSWFKNLLKPELFKDYCPNGLVIEGSHHVKSVVTGVSFCQDLIDEAVERKANCIVVHHPHGFWDNQKRLPVGLLAKKMRAMLNHHISLFAYHLPLDGHHEIGNNAGIARAIACEPYGSFMRSGQADVGLLCRFSTPLKPLELRDRITAAFGQSGVQHALLCGPESIQSIALCSGGGASGIDEAIHLGVQAYLTGELKESSPIQAREESIHLFGCGHHRTEVYGPRALAEKIQAELGIPSTFIDIPNPV